MSAVNVSSAASNSESSRLSGDISRQCRAMHKPKIALHCGSAAAVLGTLILWSWLYMPCSHVVCHTDTEAFLFFSSRQELVLLDIKSTPIKAPDTQLQNQGSLRYHFPEGLLQMPIPLIRVKNAGVQVVEAYPSHFFIIYDVYWSFDLLTGLKII